MVVEVVHDLLLVWQGTDSIPDGEWESVLTLMHRHESPELKVLVITSGGAPTPSQQLKLAALRARKSLTLAVVSGHAGVRFVASSIALFTKHVRTFTPKELYEAYAFLELNRAQLGAARHFADDQLRRRSARGP